RSGAIAASCARHSRGTSALRRQSVHLRRSRQQANLPLGYLQEKFRRQTASGNAALDPARFAPHCAQPDEPSGVSSDHAERVMGHAVGGSVQQIYDRFEYAAEKADALAKLANLIDDIVNPRENIVPMRKEKR